MVAPFTKIKVESLTGGFKGLALMLDLRRSDPNLAERHIWNYLGGLVDYSQLNRAAIADIFKKCNLNTGDLLTVQCRIIEAVLYSFLTDDKIDQKEKGDLKTLINGLYVNPDQAMKICQQIARQIYWERLKAYKSDGVITEQERNGLNSISKTFDLGIDPPSVGVDLSISVSELKKKNKKIISDAISTLSSVIEFTDKLEELCEFITNESEFCDGVDSINGWKDELEDLLDEVDEYSDANPEDYEDQQRIFEQSDQIIVEINEFNLNNFMKSMQVLSNSSKSERDKAKKEKINSRKNENKNRVIGLGFDPAGSPKQKSWVYDIIADDLLKSPFYEFSLNKSNGQDDDALLHHRFHVFLKSRPCGWWIGTFRNTDLESIFDKFKKVK